MEWPELCYKKLLDPLNRYYDTFRHLSKMSDSYHDPNNDPMRFKWSDIITYRMEPGKIKQVEDAVRSKEISHPLFQHAPALQANLPDFFRSLAADSEKRGAVPLQTSASYTEYLLSYLIDLKSKFVIPSNNGSSSPFRFSFTSEDVRQYRQRQWGISEMNEASKDVSLSNFLYIATCKYVFGPRPSYREFDRILQPEGASLEEFVTLMDEAFEFKSDEGFQRQLLAHSFPSYKNTNDPMGIQFLEAKLFLDTFGDIVYMNGPLFRMFIAPGPALEFLGEKDKRLRDSFSKAYAERVKVFSWDEVSKVEEGGLLEIAVPELQQKEIRDSVCSLRRKGASDSEIRKSLKREGYRNKLIDQVLSSRDDGRENVAVDEATKQNYRDLLEAFRYFDKWSRSPYLPYPSGTKVGFKQERFLYGVFYSVSPDLTDGGIDIISKSAAPSDRKKRELWNKHHSTYEGIMGWENVRPVIRVVDGAERYYIQRLPASKVSLKL